MANTRVASKGTKLQMKVATVFTDIGLRVELKGPSTSMETRKITHLDSTVEEVGPTIPNLGTVSGTLWFDPNDTTHIACRGKILTPPAAPDEFKMIYQTGDVVPASDDFFGYFTKFEVNPGTVMDTLSADFEITLTTSLTPTAGAAS